MCGACALWHLLSHFPLPSVSCNLKQVNFAIPNHFRSIHRIFMAKLRSNIERQLKAISWIARSSQCFVHTHSAIQNISFCVLPLYKLTWNVHLSALMWHPDQMVFRVMTDHRYTHLYNILFVECSVYTLTSKWTRRRAISMCVFKYAELTWRYGQFSL